MSASTRFGLTGKGSTREEGSLWHLVLEMTVNSICSTGWIQPILVVTSARQKLEEASKYMKVEGQSNAKYTENKEWMLYLLCALLGSVCVLITLCESSVSPEPSTESW